MQSVDEIFDNRQVLAHENVVAVADDELGSVRNQNVVGSLGNTQGHIGSAGPMLLDRNLKLLVEELGFAAGEVQVPSIPS